MDTPDRTLPMPPNKDWASPPEGILSLDFISQLANKIYGEGIVETPPSAATDAVVQQPNMPTQANAPVNPHGVMSENRPLQQTEQSAFYPDSTEKNLPANQSMPVGQDFYFLQTAENMPHDTPVPLAATPPQRQVQPSEMFDLSGERCVLAPVLPQIFQPEVAEKMIALAGRPADRMKTAVALIQEMQARQPYMEQPFFDDQAPPEAQSLSPEQQHDASLYLQQAAGQAPAEQPLYFQQLQSQDSPHQTLYFQQNANQAAAHSKPYFLKNQPAPPSQKQAEQKPERDWSDYRMFHPETVRKDFPALQQTVNGKPLVWLDNAATTQKPQTVIDALRRFYEQDNSNIHRGAHTLAARATDAYEGAREKIRQFIGAGSKDEIIYVRGTTEGINLVANAFGRQRVEQGDEIILSELEHHANIVPWQMLAQEKGARLRVIPINERGDVMLGEYERLFNQRTKIVALAQVSNALGTVLPVHEMIATAHRYGVPVIVDGAQSVQHIAVNVQEMDADFFVFSGHKLFAPTGIGAVYGKMEHLDKMPPWQGGGNMIDRVTFEETTYNTVPAKFEAGTPSIGDAIGLGVAIDYVRKIGLENIHRYETELMEHMVGALSDIPGLQIIGNPTHRAGALSFVMKNIPTSMMGQLLDREGIAVRSGHHCAQPALRHFGLDGSVRPSLAFYNTYSDVDRLREAILKVT